MEQAIEQIKVALVNSLSMNEQLRNQSLDFLINQCEPNPEFQLALLYIISNNQGKDSTPEEKQLQYQAILFMKNSLTRVLQVHRNKKIFRSNATQGLTDALKDQIKNKLVELIRAPDNVILGQQSFDQLALVACLLVKYDFPAKWLSLNEWLLTTLNQLYANLNNLQIDEIPRIQRFLGFYLEVMKEQNKKKLTSSKGQFHKVAREHLNALYQLWTFFNEKQMLMIYDQQAQRVNVDNFNELLFDLAQKLDKCLLLVIACGFSLYDLINEPKNNQYVTITQQLIEKTSFYSKCIESIVSFPKTPQTENFKNIFEDQIKNLLKHIQELQYANALIVYDSIGQYIELLANILFRVNVFSERIKKLALFSLFRVLNTIDYNQHCTDKATHSVGILVSPSKSKNFEPQMQEAADQYRFILDKPDPQSSDPKVANRKDGAKELVKLIIQNYLPMRENISLWGTDPDTFIELEDESYFISEFDLDSATTINALAHQVVEKLFSNFYSSCYQFLNEELLPQYFNGTIPISDELLEDAILSISGMIGKVQKELKVTSDKRFDICYVLDFIYQKKFQSPLLKRRFAHIIVQWTRLLPKGRFMDYFRILVDSIKTMQDPVLIYDFTRCLHEMIKEIDSQIQKQEQGHTKSSYVQANLFQFEESGLNEEEEQIKQSISINRQIDYAQVFQVVAQKTIPVMGSFQAPNIIWNMINYLTKLLEKNLDSQTIILECLHTFNIQHLLQLNSLLIDEAIIDMLKNLFIIQPDSSVILEMCISIIDYKLSQKQDALIVQLWLFIVRAVSNTNTSISNIKTLFQKISLKGDFTKDLIAIDFLKIAQEMVLMNQFPTQEETQMLLAYAGRKFQHEIGVEKQWLQQNQDKENINHDDSDDSVIDSCNLYEKKLNLVLIPHIILWRAQTDVPEALEFALSQMQDFIAMLCHYFIDFKAFKDMPSTSNFYTQAVTFINRVIVLNPDFFLNYCIPLLQQQYGHTFQSFIEAWLTKMDMFVSQEARRINLLALYNMIPHFTVEMIQRNFNDIARMTMSQLDSYMYLKMTNNESRFYSPTKVQLQQSNMTGKMKLNIVEKCSQRLEALRREDSLLNIDIVDHFWQRMEQLKAKLQIPNLEPVAQCISDEHIRQIFINLVSNNYQQQQQENNALVTGNQSILIN